MNLNIKLFFIAFFCLFLNETILSEIIPDLPNPPHLVNNFSNEFPDFISSFEQAQLEDKLVKFNDSTSNQIAIVIVDDIGDYDANGFGVALFNKWGIGRKGKNNGVLILIKPTGSAGERIVYIVVGNGLEGVIPDITAKNIVDREIIPRFKTGDFYEALNSATDVIMALAKGEFNSDDYSKENGVFNVSSGDAVPLIIFFLFFVFIAVFIFKDKGSGTIGRNGRYRGGWYGGGYSGGSSWGSSGGGGFGGFGGGHSGGGGAGGSW